MLQGHSGSTVWRNGDTVCKHSSDVSFVESPDRQRDLIALSQRLRCLPRIDSITDGMLTMAFIAGHEGLTVDNADAVGQTLRLLHRQTGYPHACTTGLDWLIDMAHMNLSHAGSDRVLEGFADILVDDTLIHTEPVQLIETADSQIVFIDIEGMGMGSRFRDLGYVRYHTLLHSMPEAFERFVIGYGLTVPSDERLWIDRVAGLTALAYAGFADTAQRLTLGLQLLDR
jgi:hypothetical protein